MDDPANLIALAGQLILENGGEIFRVEQTMSRMAQACGAAETDVFAIPTGIFCTVCYEGKILTRVVRIHRRAYNLAKVVEVNQISRQLEEGRIGVDQAYSRLMRLKDLTGQYPALLHTLAGGIGSATFAYLYGAHWGSVFAAGITGLLVMGVMDFLQTRGIFYLVSLSIAGAATALANIVLKTLWPHLEFDLAVIGSIMLLAPGIALTTTVRDALNEDILSASVRGLEALGVAFSVAVGVGTVLALYFKMGGSLL